MPRSAAALVASVFALATGVMAAGPGDPSSAKLADTLRRVGDRVERYFARAQRIVCLETVHLQPLDQGLSPAGFGRNVESELRLSWEPSPDAPLPPEAKTLRQVLRVNGRPPRKKDYDNCTTPEQNATETQPLSMLLPGLRDEYTFTLVGAGALDRHPAILIDYRLRTPPTADVSMVEGVEDCVSFEINGGMKGRIWVDADTFDVLRLDQGLTGLVDIRLPRKAQKYGRRDSWTIERMDTSIRFKAVSFSDPEETLVLPSSVSSLRVTRGSGMPRLRTVTEYTQYRRFLTGARVVGH
jgi:hypothetical protein